MARIRFSRTPAFDFEALRSVWTAPYGGGDFGEVAATMEKVRGNDFESWYREWTATGTAVAARASDMAEPVSRGRARLRASNHLRQAEFFLAPEDPRRARTSALGRDLFDGGLADLQVAVTRSRLPFEGAEIETLFLQPAEPIGRTVLVVQGGFDSTLEELYFMIGAGAAQRGLYVLMFTGPGQGSTLREFGMPFTHEWERPTAAVIDSLTGLVDPDLVIGVGISFGGHLLARAAAFEPRYDGIVLFDYFPGILDAFVHAVPAPLRSSFLRMPWWLRRGLPYYCRFDAQARWAVSNALWTFGAQTLPELITKMRPYEDRTWAARIKAHTLVLLAEREHFYDPSIARHFTDRLTGARSVRTRVFTRAEGGDRHCQNGAIELAHEVIFPWIHGLTRQASLADVAPGS